MILIHNNSLSLGMFIFFSHNFPFLLHILTIPKLSVHDLPRIWKKSFFIMSRSNSWTILGHRFLAQLWLSIISSIPRPSSVPTQLTPLTRPSTSGPATSLLSPVPVPTIELPPPTNPPLFLPASSSVFVFVFELPGQEIVDSQPAGPDSTTPVVGPTQNPTPNFNESFLRVLVSVQPLNSLPPAPPPLNFVKVSDLVIFSQNFLIMSVTL